MITTKEEIKEALGITDTADDSRISAILNQGIEAQVLNSLNRRFTSDKIYYSSTTLAFDNSNKQITDSSAEFVTDHFITGWIYIDGSYHNDGYKEVTTVEETALTLAKAPVEEDTDEIITIYQVKFPSQLKGIIARMIGEILNSNEGISAESIGSVSRTYMGKFSDSLKQELSGMRRLYL